MYLSKLELQGFKSFAERTVLHFDPGITAIVGPNGCGKSNIVDAVRWVIGEQRARILRSDKMENVIFNGTAKRKPLGMSEVLLTIENNRGVLPTEYSEVELGRRLYRSGDSEYLMNGVQCRLKDITDLFMDTGMGAGAYSVIELKMVDEILSDNADDRRRLFEEAAGITKYKLRRRQTLNKLDNTQSDLTRIRDLTDEIGKQVRSLQRQARKAEKYKESSQKLHELELALAHVEYTRLTARKAELDKEIESLQKEAEKSASSESREEKSLEELRQDLGRREQELSVHRAKLDEHLEKVRSLETERRLAEERLESARRELARAYTEQESASTRRTEHEAEIRNLEAALRGATPRLEEALTMLDEVKQERDARRQLAEEQQQTVQSLRREERDLDEKRAAQRRSLDRLLNRRELIEEDIETTEKQIAELRTSLSDLHARVTEAEDVQQQRQTAVEDARRALANATEEKNQKEQLLEEALDTVRTYERRKDALAAEVQLLESMLTSYEDFSGAVQFLASSDWSADELRTVADLLACDEEHRIALDAALGSFASCIVVENEDEARRAVDMLRREEKGRATFIVLDRLHLSGDHEHTVGAKRMRELVRTPHRNLAQVLLRDAFYVETLDRAEALAALAKTNARFFTPSGEWVDAGGIVHAGSRQDGVSPAASRLGRREQLDAARQELDEIERQLSDAQDEAAELRVALEAVAVAERREELAQAEQAFNGAEKKAARLGYELQSAAWRESELSDRIAASRQAITSTADEAEHLQSAVETASVELDDIRSRLTEAEASFEQAEAESRKASAAFNEANIAAVEARNRRDNFQRDLQRTQHQIEELDERVEERKLRISELESTIEQTQDRLEETTAAWSRIEGKRHELEKAVAYAEETVRQTREAIGNVESELRGLRRQREHLLREENQRNIRRAEVDTRAQDLVEHIEEEFRIHLPAAVAEGSINVPQDFDEKTARDQVGELRRSIRSLGGVNELALEAYEEEKERLDFLMQQQEDLESAEEKLLETINEINTTASERFLETYQLIRANFQRIFTDLFGGEAAADLELENPDDPLETAIEIKARPRGKRPSTISQLSGGEKTLTAIALLFGIYLVKPSPFCILDEVDAPLDDANVERFMRLIRQFSADTQFILVTHNKLTMEAADRLYGITMQEQGVSRLVGVKFDEAVQIADRPAPREAA